MNDKYIIIFDGVCNFCNFWVNLILDRDKHDVFRFTPLQSEAGKKLLSEAGMPETLPDTFVLRTPSGFYTKSTAGLKVAQKIGFPFNLLYLFIFLPAFLRDAVYDIIAKNRYSFFGKKESCRIPTPAERAKFL